MADGLLNKASIILTPTGYKAGTLYNVAPVVEPYEDFDFARASVASRVNSSGLVEMVGRTLGSELVTNGDFSSGSTSWSTIGSGITITDRANFNTDDNESLAQEGVLTNGKTYKVVFDILSVEDGSVSVWAQTNGYIQTFTTIGTKEVYFTYDGTDGQIRFRGTFGTGFEGSIDNISVKEIIDTNNIPRISYDSNGDNGHILLEPTSTNLI